MKIINFWLRQCILLVPTCALTKRNFEKFLLEATKSCLQHFLWSHFEGNRTKGRLDLPFAVSFAPLGTFAFFCSPLCFFFLSSFLSSPSFCVINSDVENEYGVTCVGCANASYSMRRKLRNARLTLSNPNYRFSFLGRPPINALCFCLE
jgi:hypothetical protein